MTRDDAGCSAGRVHAGDYLRLLCFASPGGAQGGARRSPIWHCLDLLLVCSASKHLQQRKAECCLLPLVRSPCDFNILACVSIGTVAGRNSCQVSADIRLQRDGIPSIQEQIQCKILKGSSLRCMSLSDINITATSLLAGFGRHLAQHHDHHAYGGGSSGYNGDGSGYNGDGNNINYRPYLRHRSDGSYDCGGSSASSAASAASSNGCEAFSWLLSNCSSITSTPLH